MVQIKAGKSYALKSALDYITNPDKTDNGLFVSGKDCFVKTAYEQMMITKYDHTQNTGRQYIHIIQSFALHDNIMPEMAHEIGQKLLQEFEGFQGVIATHTDRDHLHNHIVLNSVNWQTGLKWQQSKDDLQALKKRSDELCKEYSLSVIERGKGWKSYGENAANNRDCSWKMQLAKDISHALQNSDSIHQFYRRLHTMGITADFYDNKVIFTDVQGHKCGNDKLMAYGDFSVENMQKLMEYNNIAIRNAYKDMRIIVEAYDTVSRLLFPDDPGKLHRDLFNHNLDALSDEEVQRYILAQKTQQFLDQTANTNRQTQQEEKNSGKFLGTVADLLELALNEQMYLEYNPPPKMTHLPSHIAMHLPKKQAVRTQDDDWDYEI